MWSYLFAICAMASSGLAVLWNNQAARAAYERRYARDLAAIVAAEELRYERQIAQIEKEYSDGQQAVQAKFVALSAALDKNEDDTKRLKDMFARHFDDLQGMSAVQEEVFVVDSLQCTQQALDACSETLANICSERQAVSSHKKSEMAQCAMKRTRQLDRVQQGHNLEETDDQHPDR